MSRGQNLKTQGPVILGTNLTAATKFQAAGTFFQIRQASGLITVQLDNGYIDELVAGEFFSLPQPFSEVQMASSVAGDQVIYTYGNGIKGSSNITSIQAGLPSPITAFTLASGFSQQNTPVPGDFKKAVLNFRNFGAGTTIEIAVLDATNTALGSSTPPNPPGWPIYYPDGSVAAQCNQSFAIPTASSQFTLIVPLGGGSVLSVANLGANNITVSGQFTNGDN